MSTLNRERYNDLRAGISALFGKIASDIKDARQFADHAPLGDKLTRLTSRYGAAIADIGAHEQGNDTVIDRLINEWSGAQALILMPELLDDTNPDIEEDVSDMLIGAESILEGLVDGHLTPELAQAENETLKDLYSFNDVQCTVFANLNAAEEVLEAYQDTLQL